MVAVKVLPLLPTRCTVTVAVWPISIAVVSSTYTPLAPTMLVAPTFALNLATSVSMAPPVALALLPTLLPLVAAFRRSSLA